MTSCYQARCVCIGNNTPHHLTHGDAPLGNQISGLCRRSHLEKPCCAVGLRWLLSRGTACRASFTLPFGGTPKLQSRIAEWQQSRAEMSNAMSDAISQACLGARLQIPPRTPPTCAASGAALCTWLSDLPWQCTLPSLMPWCEEGPELKM